MNSKIPLTVLIIIIPFKKSKRSTLTVIWWEQIGYTFMLIWNKEYHKHGNFRGVDIFAAINDCYGLIITNDQIN